MGVGKVSRPHLFLKLGSLWNLSFRLGDRPSRHPDIRLQGPKEPQFMLYGFLRRSFWSSLADFVDPL